jgi:hypothetical protein
MCSDFTQQNGLKSSFNLDGQIKAEKIQTTILKLLEASDLKAIIFDNIQWYYSFCFTINIFTGWIQNRPT